MKTLAENIKCLAAPKHFMGLTFRKGIVGYTLLVTLILTGMINALYYALENPGAALVNSLNTSVPDFSYESGELRFNSDKKFEYGNENSYLYINTSVKSFSIYNISDYVDIAKVNARQRLFVSRSNLLMIDEGVNTAPLTELLGTDDFDKAGLLDSLTQVAPWFFVGFSALATIIGIFFWSLVWGLIAYIINRFQKIKYSYARIYRLAVYVLIPMRILKLLCIRFILSFIPVQGASGIITWAFRGLIVLYLILALFMDENQRSLRADNAF